MLLYTVLLLQLAVVVSWRYRSAEDFRQRAQCLTCIEHLALLYRAILPIPVWYKFFEDSGMGIGLCAVTTGGCANYLAFLLELGV